MATEYLVDIDRDTGEYISGWPRIKQSIRTILTTRLRWRIMRLWWGSSFLDMQDKPGNEEVLMNGIMAAIAAINTYEPEFKVRRVVIDSLGPDGSITITTEGVDLVESAIKSVRTTLV
jgi:phage baseplate assembly protein W